MGGGRDGDGAGTGTGTRGGPERRPGRGRGPRTGTGTGDGAGTGTGNGDPALGRRTDVGTRSLLALSLLLLVGCQGIRDRPPPGAEIRGRVLAGPRCPVVTEASPCPDLPWVGRVRATGEAGVFEARTDEAGRFVLVVPPGTYTVQAVVEGGGPPTAKPESVRVGPGSSAQVTLRVDTGIR